MDPQLFGDGKMGAAIRTFDWTATPLGDPVSWPAPLRASATLMLDTIGPAWLAWGPDLTFLYNDAYGPLLGGKPAALGRPLARVWAEVWPDVLPLIERTLAGESVLLNDLALRVDRGGEPEDAFFTFSYAPLRNEAGSVQGLYCAVVETTATVLAGRRRDADIAERTLERDRMWSVTRDPLAVSDLHGVLLAVNPAWSTMLGWTEEELLGRTSEWLEHPADKDKTRAETVSLGQGVASFAFEHRLRARDGSYRTLSWSCVPQGDRIYCSARDMTDERRAVARREMLADIVLRQRATSDETEVMHSAAAALGTYLDADRAGFFQLPDDDTAVFAGSWSNGKAPPLEGAFPVAGLGPALVQVRQGETLIANDTRSDPQVAGSVFPAIGTLSAIGVPLIRDGRWWAGLYVNHGEPREWRLEEVDVAREVAELTWDAVERLRARSGLAERTSERDRIWASTTDLMGTATLQGHLSAVNPAWTRMLGWSEEELLAKPFAEIIDPIDHAETADVVRRLSEGQTVTGFVDHVIASDGSQRTIMWDAVPELGTHTFYIVGRDLSAQRQAEEQLRQSQKMEAVGQLTGGLAHDFNNLLAGISGSLELLGRRIAQGRVQDAERYVVAAQGAAKRAAALTHRLLAFSRRQTLAPKPTDVNKLVGGLLDLIQRTVGPSIHVDLVTMSGLWTALVDGPQLENALLNLSLNARDAMPDGGNITIETANRWIDRHGAKQHDLPEGQYLSVCVSDTGTGMTKDVIARAFDPFFTTKPIGQGTGLGLSMIHGFARQSGGQVRIYSEVGQGTMVCIYLPRHRGEADEVQLGHQRGALPQAEVGETVLVVDDEPTVRMLVTDVLDELGYTAIEASDSAGGLRVLQSDARVDLLISDVGLPGMNGKQMVDAARVNRPDLKVLFITGFAENALLNHGQLEPGMSVLTKPFAVDVLAARIRELISK